MNSKVNKKSKEKKVSRLSTATNQESPGDVIDKYTGIDTRIAALQSYGCERARYAKNFKKWISETRTTKQQFVKHLEKAMSNENEKTHINYDGEAVDLVIDDLCIYFDTMHFEDYVGDQLQYGPDPASEGEWVDAKEHLLNEWKRHAEDFIMNNLHRAEIDNSEL